MQQSRWKKVFKYNADYKVPYKFFGIYGKP